MSSDLKEFVEAWMLKADHDVVGAERLIEIEPVILDGACFHCQQAVEKSLKAFLCYNGVDIERTHNVQFLLDECAKFDPVFIDIDPKDINRYAVQGRYPDDTLMPEVEEARYFYELAKQVFALVRSKLVF